MKEDTIGREMLISFARGQLSREESLRVLEKVEVDSDLSEELEEVLSLVRGIEDIQNLRGGEKTPGRIVREQQSRYLLKVAAALVVAFLSTVTIGELSKGQYFYLARMEETGLSKRLRGNDGNQIEWAKRMFVSGNRDVAIREMERIANILPEEESKAVVHMILGEMLLCSAERSYLGVFSWYDTGYVVRAMDHLGTALEWGDPRIAEEAHWLRFKGYLMLGDRDGARREGVQVLKIGKDRSDETRNALEQIDNE